MKYFLTTTILLFALFSKAQNTGVLNGTVLDKNTGQYLQNARLEIGGSTLTTLSDSAGKFRISLPVGTYTISARNIGYQDQVKYNVLVTSGNVQIVNFEMIPVTNNIQQVEVSFNRNRSAVATDLVTPLSVQQLTQEEIRSNPGGNFDVSKVVQTLPGVGIRNGQGGRNDIIIRGGAPNENVYYLDGIEIPVLNHFQTQGSSGGAQGILNVSFIESLKLSSSAFDARYDNPLSSTFVIKQRDGNSERISGNARVSFTESAITLEGPITEKTTFLASARKSYLGFLFKLIDLPIRPNFEDFQYKVTYKINEKTTLTAIGLGAIDRFSFAVPKESTPENLYTLRSTPFINQWSYTAGFNLNRRIENGFFNLSLSRNSFNNRLDKFEDQQRIESTRTLGLSSQEDENKLRFDINKFVNGWKLSAGLMTQIVGSRSNIFNRVSNEVRDTNGTLISPARTISFNSDINFWKYGAFIQASKELFDEKLLLSAGLRSDLNSFTKNGMNALKTLAPRLSLALHASPRWDINASIGTYHKIPAYTALGFISNTGVPANNTLKYIRSDHFVLGTQFMPKDALRFTFEVFKKNYHNYPVSAATGISLANSGAEFSSVGSEALIGNGNGRTYGFEIFVQQKLEKKLFYVASYTYVRSKFSGANGLLIPSSWDNEHLLSATLGYKFKRDWDLGLKYRMAGGSPYTPFDLQASQQNYLTLGTGVFDNAMLNALRLRSFQQLDARIDKRLNFRKTTFSIYLDLQNVLRSKNDDLPKYTFKRNASNTGFETTYGQPLQANGSNAIPVILDTSSGTLIPSVGFIFEF